MAHPPASAPQAPSKKRKRMPTRLTIPKSPPTRTTLTPFHFARLTAIWELDRRIPSPASRAAWAAARGVDLAKGSYEMEVGDVEAEEEERKAREEKSKIKKEVEEVDSMQMRKMEEEPQEDIQDIRATSAVAPTPPPTLPSSPILTSIDDFIPTPADLKRALYEGITFTPCFDISPTAVP
ncbi:hypothetical protein DFP72DRAFT_1079314 [Ephemerocybe angulata]|uniref:Uncharacterized protein n=1 Tax=Ephemerocybe angulata TaxID=980116 RepID=A0A8H6LX45_9AGAR|nr:hypothetical protein DFP72DRAFT_1079314 [Tulosesus angulatus]